MKCWLSLAFVAVLAVTATASPFPKDVIYEHNPFSRFRQAPSLPTTKSRSLVETKWIEQKLDHFDDTETRTWQMRYMANDEFYQQGGPLIIFVGGSWTIHERYLQDGLMYDMARDNNAYLFYTEYRFYGESKPLSDLSVESLKYLHVRQALADLAHFIRTVKAENPGMQNSNVILIGTSYSAAVATWFKELYPELVTGVWASSAPVLAKFNFADYYERAGNVIRSLGGDACYNRIQEGITDMEMLFANKRGAEIKAMFPLCNNFDENNDLDQWVFFSEVADVIAGTVVFHTGQSIQGMCKLMLDAEDAMTGVIKFTTIVMRPAECYDLSYAGLTRDIMNPDYTVNGMRPWIYQTCNEYGWYQTSDSKNQPFGTKIPLTLYTRMCYDAFGPQFSNENISKNVLSTNAMFGGLDPAVTDVYMSHGELDPWLGVGTTHGDVTVIPEYSHSKDFTSISDRDKPAMRANKERIAQLVHEWANRD